MEIIFRTKRLKKIFCSSKDLKRNYGERTARLIQNRLAVLSNASSLSRVPRIRPERLHQLSGNRKGQFAVDLVHPRRLIFEPNHDPMPVNKEGGIDRDMVTAITIIEVTDYH